jgi:hypothetical protein
MDTLERFPGLFPRLLAGVAHVGPILGVRQLRALTCQPSATRPFPCRDVEHDFPNAVCTADRSGGCLLRCYPFENFRDRWAMPGLTFIGPFQLIRDSLDFNHDRLIQTLSVPTGRRIQLGPQVFPFQIEFSQWRCKRDIVILIRIEAARKHFAAQSLIHFAQFLFKLRSPETFRTRLCPFRN